MTQTLEELQAILAERIAKLDEERQANARQQAKEREAMLLEVEMERQKRMAEYQEKIAAHEAKKRAEEAEKEAQRIKEVAERVAAEQKQLALDETLRLQREKLEWLTNAIADAEFAEEQHKKSLENARIPVQSPVVEGATIDIEFPTSPVNTLKPGEAVDGTEGNTPETPLMSQHLKHILRQASRNY